MSNQGAHVIMITIPHTPSLQIFVVLNSKEIKRSNKYDNKVNMTLVMKDSEGAGIAADEALG